MVDWGADSSIHEAKPIAGRIISHFNRCTSLPFSRVWGEGQSPTESDGYYIARYKVHLSDLTSIKFNFDMFVASKK